MMVRLKTVHGPLLLRVFGVPNLLCREGASTTRVIPLRRKDLALLIYLCFERKRTHSRSSLASLLWGDASDEHARHSLTQALSRLKGALGKESLDWNPESIEWRGEVETDADTLDRGDRELAIRLPTFEFLSDFCIGRGGAEFEIWAEGKRSHYRVVALRILGSEGDEAEAARDWERALSVGQREIAVEVIHEAAHRRVMRAWSGMGERGLALQHYRRFSEWLETELDENPEPETQELAHALRESTTDDREAAQIASWVGPSAGPAFSGIAASYGSRLTVRERSRGVGSAVNRPTALALSVWFLFALLAATFVAPLGWLDADRIPIVPGEGMPFITSTDDLPARLHNGVLSVFPDWETADACLGGRRGVIAGTDHAPVAAARVIPSVLDHPWLTGRSLVQADSDSTVYALVGCVKSPVMDARENFVANPDAILTVPAELLEMLPTGGPLTTPVRPAGTVLRVRKRPDMRWVVYGGGALSVRSPRVLSSHCKRTAVEVDAVEFASYRVVGRLRGANQACAAQSMP